MLVAERAGSDLILISRFLEHMEIILLKPLCPAPKTHPFATCGLRAQPCIQRTVIDPKGQALTVKIVIPMLACQYARQRFAFAESALSADVRVRDANTTGRF